ncbi:MAG: hypothetical protein WC728_03100 [Elusimicrobiota bacterium]
MNFLALLLASWAQAQTLQTSLPNPAAATPIPGTNLPGVVIPRLPIPIETPTWPTQPIRLPSVLPTADNVPVSLPGAATPVYPAGIPKPVGQAVRVYPSAAAVPVRKAVLHVRETLRMAREEKPSAAMLHAAFDGVEPPQSNDVVDAQPSEEDNGGSQTPPWVTRGRQPTLPEWDLEREIGLRP